MPILTIELNHTEIETIEKALDSWEKEEALNAAMMGMMMAIVAGREHRDEAKRDNEESSAKAKAEGERRKRVSTMLRAKLYQASAKLSEHPNETAP